MTNKKLFKSAVIITAVMLSVGGCAGGCSKQTEPVIADATVETPEPEENIETKEPTPSPTVEPTEESIDDTVSSESEDNIASEEDTINEEDIQNEEVEPDLGYTIIAIDEVTMYATTNANLRSGPGTQYDIVGSLSYAQEITVDGKVEKDGKQWFVLQSDTEEKQMVSGSLVVYQKPQPQQSSGGSSSTGTSGNNNTQTQTPPPAESQQPSSNDEGGAVAGDVVDGIVVEDAGSMDWSGGGREWH
jgi:hypothetical protein